MVAQNEPGRCRQRTDFRVHQRSWQIYYVNISLSHQFFTCSCLSFSQPCFLFLPLVRSSYHSQSDLRHPRFLSKDLPTSAGWLAHWQLLVATTAVFNFVQNFVTLKFTRRIYNNIPSNTGEYFYCILFSALGFTRWEHTSDRPASTYICRLDFDFCSHSFLCCLQH